MFKVHGAVLPHAEGSTRHRFGDGVEKTKRIYLMGRIGQMWLSLAEEIKYRKLHTRLSLPCE